MRPVTAALMLYEGTLTYTLMETFSFNSVVHCIVSTMSVLRAKAI